MLTASRIPARIMSGKKFRRRVSLSKKQLLMGVMGKLIVAPLVFLSLAVLMGIRGVGLACVFISFGAPTAVSSYPMAQQMGGDGELAAEIVAMTSVFSIVTTFLFIFLLKTMAFI